MIVENAMKRHIGAIVRPAVGQDRSGWPTLQNLKTEVIANTTFSRMDSFQPCVDEMRLADGDNLIVYSGFSPTSQASHPKIIGRQRTQISKHLTTHGFDSKGD